MLLSCLFQHFNMHETYLEHIQANLEDELVKEALEKVIFQDRNSQQFEGLIYTTVAHECSLLFYLKDSILNANRIFATL